ncbi:hypothetical protein JZ751_001023 [Albula glossodonta]|uniref:Ricin B lectin domain-containing protein n=1 Tax=Albula glossodonta TaxID=121402 RepID=A0A8T2PSM3_9TELE|nr:hypothetical protein JZ751_001023 [Albula glossodonta]
MERGAQIVTVVVLMFQEAVGFSIRNEQLGKCLQPLEAIRWGGRVTLEDCRPGSALQQWKWHPETPALVSMQTGECLSAPGNQEDELIRLQACRTGDGAREGQVWGCSKKGHLTLIGKGLHLSAHQGSAKVLLSRDRSRGSKWRTLGNHTVCGEPGGPHHVHHHDNKPTSKPSSTIAASGASTHSWQSSSLAAVIGDGMAVQRPRESSPEKELSALPYSTTGPVESPESFFSLEYGMGWKITMLVLSSLALVIGLVILLLNIYYNRRKKVVCVVKSYTPKEAVSQQGSPVPNERAPLTKHPMKPPRSPSLQRGEILIEWKDGTITPLFDNSSYLTD